MWAELADTREQFIGGELQDLDPEFKSVPVTPIVNLGFDGQIFTVLGRDYGCSVNRDFAGLSVKDGWLVITYPYGRFRFRRLTA